MITARNRTEPAVNRRLGFEVAPNTINTVIGMRFVFFFGSHVERSKSDFFFHFFKLLTILVSQKEYIFLITRGKFYSSKMFRLEDNNEFMTCYGNQN